MKDIENSPLEHLPEADSPENITPPAAGLPTQAGISFFAKLKTKRPIVLGTLGSIIIFAAIIFAVYSYGTREQEVQPTPSVTLTPVAVTVTPFITPVLTPTVITPSPTISSEGKIAFVRDGNLWTIFPNGTGEMQLTEAKTIHGTGAPNPDYVEIPEDVENPDWSPDGSSIVFNDTSDGNIWTATGYTVKKLIASPLAKQGAVTYSAPKWSPDGQKIAFFVTGDQYSGLTVANKDGDLLYEFKPSDFIAAENFYLVSRVHAVAAPGLLVNSFVWVQDSKNLLVGVKGYPMDETRKDRQEIWQVSIEGGKTKIIENGANPDLSPNSAKVIYTTKEEPNSSINKSRIYLLPLESMGSPEEIAVGPAWNLKFSPNGKYLAYLAGFASTALEVIEPETKKEVLSIPARGNYYSWSPNSQLLVYDWWHSKISIDLWIINITDGKEQKLTTNASQPVWSPR